MAFSNRENDPHPTSESLQQTQQCTLTTTAISTVPAAIPSSGSSDAGSDVDEEFLSVLNNFTCLSKASIDAVQQHRNNCTSPIFDMLLNHNQNTNDLESSQSCIDMNRICFNDINHNNSNPAPKIPSPMGSLFRSSTVPTNQLWQYNDLINKPSSLRLDAWSEAFAHNFMVRGSTYLQDNKKVNSESSVFQLLTVDLVKSDTPNFHGLCSHPNERIQLALQKEKMTGMKQLPNFIFAVNLCVPASASTTMTATTAKSPSKTKSTSCYHLVSYFGIDDKSIITDMNTPIGRLCNEFFFGSSDQFRNSTFKLIPRITEGNFVVRKAVGSKPSIIGKKLKQYYIQNERYMELIIDIGSDSVATRIVKLALGYAKTLTVDMMFVLEGTTMDTLPERIIGGVRIKEVDFKDKDGQRHCTRL